MPDDFDPATVTDAMIEEIHALNRESLLPAPGSLPAASHLTQFVIASNGGPTRRWRPAGLTTNTNRLIKPRKIADF